MRLNSSPPTKAEYEIIVQVKMTLEDMDIEYEDSSLAAAVVRSWVPLMMDVRINPPISTLNLFFQCAIPLTS